MKLLITASALLIISTVYAADDLKCEEGKVWKMDCNSCTCINGLPACTEMACKPEPARHVREIYDETECEEGTSWQLDCNRCTCMNGKAACTQMGCVPPPEHFKGHASTQRRFVRGVGRPALTVKANSYKINCKPGDVWRDEDCNKCVCNDDVIAICTKRLCSSGHRLVPTPGWQEMFYIQDESIKTNIRYDV